MADEIRDVLTTGLRNAHAMEKQAEDMMQNQHKRLDDYPELKARVGQHIEETRGQIARLDGCLKAMNTSHSTMKDMATQLAGNMQTMMHTAASDEILKNSFASFAFENFEIASYKALIAIANEAGEAQVASACEANLREEMDMAGWLDQHLDGVVKQYLSHVVSEREGHSLA